MNVHDFSLTPVQQTTWSWLRALNQSLTGLGAGLFLVSLVLDFSTGAMSGWLLILLGNATLVTMVGRADRLWLIVLKVRLSWTSRGVVASGALIGLGFLYWALLLGWLPLQLDSIGYWAIRILACIAAFFVLLLDGFVMNSIPGIALWKSRLIPPILLWYGIAGGAILALALLSFDKGVRADSTRALSWGAAGLIGLSLVLIVAYMISMFNGDPDARNAARLFYRGTFSLYWLGLVIGVGLVAPLVLIYFAIATLNVLYYVAEAIAVSGGAYALHVLLFRAGAYRPVVVRLAG